MPRKNKNPRQRVTFAEATRRRQASSIGYRDGLAGRVPRPSSEKYMADYRRGKEVRQMTDNSLPQFPPGVREHLDPSFPLPK